MRHAESMCLTPSVQMGYFIPPLLIASPNKLAVSTVTTSVANKQPSNSMLNGTLSYKER